MGYNTHLENRIKDNKIKDQRTNLSLQKDTGLYCIVNVFFVLLSVLDCRIAPPPIDDAVLVQSQTVRQSH